MSNKKENIILFLGQADTDGATAKLKATGTLYKRKMLESGVENWKTILDFFDNYNVSTVIVKLTSYTFEYLCSEEYQQVVEDLLNKISSVPNIFLAHESLITGERTQPSENDAQKFGDFDTSYFDNYFDSIELPSKAEINKVIGILKNHKMEIIPYKKNVELTIITSAFLEQNEHNLVFRFYIPSERMWANETEKLLQLFREYLQKVSGFNVRQDQYRTNQGIVYEFFSDDVESVTLPETFREFSEFMDNCSNDPDNAQLLLESKNLNKQEIINIIEKYSKEARRLQIDLKQERERKLLSIRHRLESDLGEYATSSEDWNFINQIVNYSVPQIEGISVALKLDEKPLIQTPQNLTINIKPQYIESVNSVIAQEIMGDQHLGTNGKELLEIINKYGEGRRTELATAVHELADENVKEKDRINAKHKLKGFVLGVADKIGDVAVKMLQKYIESQLGL